jgi:hypothetical protein
MSPSQMWVPDLIVYDLHNTMEIGTQAISVYPSGDCYWSSQRKFTVGCVFDLTVFPFDKQRCNFTVGSNSYDGSVLDVVPRTVSPSQYTAVGDSALAPKSAVGEKVLSACTPAGKHTLFFTQTLR